MKRTGFYGNKEKVTALILLRKIICMSSDLNGRTGRTLCGGRTFRLWGNSTFLSKFYSYKVEFKDFRSTCERKKETDRIDRNSSFSLILHSQKWVAKHLLTSVEIKPQTIKNTHIDPYSTLLDSSFYSFLNKKVEKEFVSIMPSS